MRTKRYIAFMILALALSADDTSPVSNLPPRFFVNTEEEARKLAWPEPVPIAGTGSMKPYIPESPDPDKVVAIVAVEHPPYEQLEKDDLVIFRWKGKSVIHQIVARQGDNWISSGLDNDHYDGPSVTRDNFESRVVRVYIIKQAVDDE